MLNQFSIFSGFISLILLQSGPNDGLLLEKSGEKLKAIQYGVIKMNKEKNHLIKLKMIFDSVNNLIDEEILYREALLLGLDQEDTIIKRRLAQKISFLK